MSSGERLFGNRCAFVMFACCLAAVLVVFYLPWLSGRHSLYQSDLTYYFEPFIKYICDSYRHGRVPLWNPYIYCGMSQVAVPSPGIFYPFIFLWMLPVAFSQGLAAFLVAHQWTAGVGAFLFVEALGWGVLAALVAGTAIALCGYFFSLQANFTLVATVAWLPLLMYALHSIDGTFTRRNVLKVFAASVVFGLMVAAGRPELSVPCALIAGCYVVLSGLSLAVAAGDRHAATGNAVFTTLARLIALTAGGALAMPILLPAVEWARLSPRAHGLAPQWVLMWSANWYDTLCLACAQPLGDLTVLRTKFLNLGAGRLNAIPYVQSTYIGPIVLTFALWSLMNRRWKWKWAMVALFAASLVMALGSHIPLGAWLVNTSPVFAAFRYPVKLMIFPAIALVVLAAHGAGMSDQKSISCGAQISTAVLWAVLLIIGMFMIAIPSMVQIYYAFPLKAHNMDRALMINAQKLLGENFAATACLGLLVNAFYFAFARFGARQNIYRIATVVLLAGCLVLPAWKYLRHRSAGDFYARYDMLGVTARKKYLRSSNPAVGGAMSIQQRGVTLYFDPLTPSSRFIEAQRLDYQDGFYFYSHYVMLPNSNIDCHVPYSFGYEAAEVENYKLWFTMAISLSSQNRKGRPGDQIFDAPLARFCEMTATNLLLTQMYQDGPNHDVKILDPKFFTLVSEDPFTNIRMYRSNETFPRAYIVRPPYLAKLDWKTFYDRVTNRSDDRMIYHTYVEEDLPDAWTCCDNDAAKGTKPSPVIFDEDSPERVAMHVALDRPGLLVLTDHFYPGWRCSIDGAPAHIYRTNFFGRGVMVKEGTHKIVYTYDPDSVRYGWYSFAAVVALFAGALMLRKSDRDVAAGNARGESESANEGTP